MFEYYNHVKEITLIFQNGRLIFANESACHFLNCYFHSIEGKEPGYLIKSGSLENDGILQFQNGICLDCVCRNFEEDGGNFLLIRQKGMGTEKEIKLTTPKALYDPLMLGKAAIMTQRIAAPIQNILDSIDHLIKESDGNLKLKEELQEISKNVGDVYGKTKYLLEEYQTLTMDLDQTVYCFDLTEAAEVACRKIQEYLELKKLPVKVSFSSRGGPIMILADKGQIVRVITGLIANTAGYLASRQRQGKVNLKVIADSSSAAVVIEDNSKDCLQLMDKLAYAEAFSILEEGGREVMSLQMVNSLIEKNNGTLNITNRKGIGIRYTLRFPLTGQNGFMEREKELDYDSIISHEMDFFLNV